MKLSKLERVHLILQFKLLNAATKSDDYDHVIDILEGGYEIFYGDVASAAGVYDSMPIEDSKFVFDILDVYRVLGDFFKEHPEDELAELPFAQFRGFDGNDSTEGRCIAFAFFLINKQEKWTEQKGREKDTDNFNAHMPTMAIYRKMIAAWEGMKREYPLSREQVAEILAR